MSARIFEPGPFSLASRKAKSLAHDPKSLAHSSKTLAAKAPGLAREVPEPHCRAKSPTREAPRLGREARRAGAEAEAIEAGARGLGREAWRPGEPARRKAGDAARPPGPFPRPVRRDGTLAVSHTDLSHLILSKWKHARRVWTGVSIRVFQSSGSSRLWGKPDLSWDVRLHGIGSASSGIRSTGRSGECLGTTRGYSDVDTTGCA